MIWLLLLPLLILFFWLQKHYVDQTGENPRSRSSVRRQRREARKSGIAPEALDYNYRFTPASTPFRVPRWLEIVLLFCTVSIIGALIFWR
jgi:hypothetical protein